MGQELGFFILYDTEFGSSRIVCIGGLGYRIVGEFGMMQTSDEIVMTREEAIERLKKAQGCGDTERSHEGADEVLCEVLLTLGYGDVVEEYRNVEKWYG